MKVIFPIVLCLCFCASTCLSQLPTMSGQVIDVSSGDTVIIESSGTKFMIKLQFIDAPEASQPLYGIVKAHLAQLALSKTVEFRPNALGGIANPGRLLINGADLSLQMLRDGAVWYSVPDADRQEPGERSLYQQAESKAKDEKLGIWGVAGIRPAYELRLEREKKLQEQIAAERKKMAEEIARLGLPPKPSIGMSYVQFRMICSLIPSDYISVTETENGSTGFLSLSATRDRLKSGCWGDFSFNEKGQLDYIKRNN